MLITDGDRLKNHFKTVVDVKHFTPEEICTIIDTFSIDIPEDAQIVMTRNMGHEMVYNTLKKMMSFKTTKISEAESEVQSND